MEEEWEQVSFRFDKFSFSTTSTKSQCGKKSEFSFNLTRVTRVTVVCSHYLGDEGPPGAQDVGGDVDGGKE